MRFASVGSTGATGFQHFFFQVSVQHSMEMLARIWGPIV